MNKFDFFVNKYCKKCKEPCEKGLYKTGNIIKCADTGIVEKIQKEKINTD